jgi:hypothetical protein
MCSVQKVRKGRDLTFASLAISDTFDQDDALGIIASIDSVLQRLDVGI